MSLAIRHLDLETLHYHFGYGSDEVMCYVLDNVEDIKKFHFLTYICHGYTLEKMHQHSFSENSVHFSKLLGLIHSDLLELPTLFKVQVGDYISQ